MRMHASPPLLATRFLDMLIIRDHNVKHRKTSPNGVLHVFNYVRNRTCNTKVWAYTKSGALTGAPLELLCYGPRPYTNQPMEFRASM